jgi:hypothetical protein
MSNENWVGSSNLGRLSHKPTLILWGDRNNGFRDAERKRSEELFPPHPVRMVLDSKHFVQEEAPEQICEEVIALMRLRTGCTKDSNSSRENYEFRRIFFCRFHLREPWPARRHRLLFQWCEALRS